MVVMGDSGIGFELHSHSTEHTTIDRNLGI